MTQSQTAIKPKRVFLIYTEDAGELSDIVYNEAANLGPNVEIIKPASFGRWGRPIWEELPKTATMANFAVVILTEQYLRDFTLGTIPSVMLPPGVRDTLYVFPDVPLDHKSSPHRTEGPWNAPGYQMYAMVSPGQEDRFPREVRERLESLIKTCSRCGNLCRFGSMEYTLAYNEEVTISLCGDCVLSDEIKAYHEFGIINTELTNAILDREDFRNREKTLPLDVVITVNQELERINYHVDRFNREIWFAGGLQKYYQDPTSGGHRLDAGEISALMWESAGRVLITFQHNQSEATITLIADEDKKRPPSMGVQSIQATGDEAINLLTEVYNAYLQGARFSSNRDVAPPVVLAMRYRTDQENPKEDLS